MGLILAHNSIDDLDVVLITAFIVVCVLLLVAVIFSFIARIRVWVIYSKFNKIKNSEGLTAKEAAEKFRDLVGLENVDVQQCSWWRALFSLGGPLGFGNNYSIYKKVIFLRKNIINKESITAVGVATQKVGLALQDKEGDKLYRFTARVKPFLFFAPTMFLPLVFVGIIIDMVALNTIGIATIITTLSGVLIYLLSFFIILFTIKAEKKANKRALELMESQNFLTEEERGYIKRIYKAYITLYIAEFTIALLQLIKYILQILGKLKKGKK